MKHFKYFISALLIVSSQLCSAEGWIGSWACAPQKAGNNDLPHGKELSNSSVRQVVHLSVAGDSLRLKLSNEHSEAPLEIKSVYIANTQGGCEIDQKSLTELKFKGVSGADVPWGGTVVSDPVAFRTSPLQLLSITVNYGDVPEIPTIHGGSRTTSYILPNSCDVNADYSEGQKELHWYSISGVDVWRKDSPKCIAALGNSITDGRGTTNDKQNRWTDVVAENFNGEVAVLNLGIGGNCVVRGGLGPTGKSRYATDILGQSGLTHIIVFEGINDLGSSQASQQTVDDLIKAYRRFIRKAHDRGLKIYGATITPMKGSGHYSPEHETLRKQVNNWILTSGEFDGVLDINSVVMNPEDPEELKPEYQFDTLHPNAEGYKAIGDYIANELKNALK